MIRNLSYRVYYVFLRNLISYKRFIIPTFLVSLGEPLFYLVTFGVGLGAYMGKLGEGSYIQFLAPGVLISAVMMASAFECMYGTFVKMIHEKLYDSLIATPVSAEDSIAGDVLWGAFRGTMSGSLMLLAAVFLGVHPTSIFNVLLLLLLMFNIGILFGSLSMIITSFAPNFDFFNYYTELFITPMFFFSGIFFPLSGFPVWVQNLANILPLTHAVNISRAVFWNNYRPELIINLLVLLVIEVIAFYFGLFFMKKRLIK